MLPADDDDARVGDVPSPLAVSIEIVADGGILGNADVLVEDGATKLGATSDVAIVHDDAAFDTRSGVDANAASENGFANEAAGKNASAGYDAVDGFSAASFFVEHKLGGRIRIAGAAHRPLAVVKIEFRLNFVQVHVGFVEGLDGANIAPVGEGVSGLARDPVRLEIVGVDGGFASEFGEDVMPKS